MISIKELVDKANALIDQGGLTELQLSQLSGIVDSIKNGSVYLVQNLSELPDAEDNTGRMVYVIDENSYFYSDGMEWINNFDREETVIGTFIFSWGNNGVGRLGDNTTTNRSSPVSVVGGITNWSQVSAGSDHSLGLTGDGIAYACGNNFFGRLGDNTTTNRSSPVSVVGGITNWSQVSGGSDHSLGLTEDGIVYAWGLNSFGRLGDNTTTSRRSPVSVVGGITNWSQVSAAGTHSLGLTEDGTVYAWGRNNIGQLGDNTTTDRSSPVSVVGGITNWSQVSGGAVHSLGITEDGIAYAWGNNGYGRLGDNTGTNRSSPVSVVGGITNWSQVSGGDAHSLGVTEDGIAYAWGNNFLGRLGDNTTTSRSSPITVVGGITNWSQVSAAGTHSLGLTEDGIAYAWGNNTNGQLGDDTTTSRNSPVSVVGGITNWSQVSAAGTHSSAIKVEVGFD